MFCDSGDETVNSGIDLRAFESTETTCHLQSDFSWSDVSFGLIIGKWHHLMPGKSQHGFPFFV